MAEDTKNGSEEQERLLYPTLFNIFPERIMFTAPDDEKSIICSGDLLPMFLLSMTLTRLLRMHRVESSDKTCKRHKMEISAAKDQTMTNSASGIQRLLNERSWNLQASISQIMAQNHYSSFAVRHFESTKLAATGQNLRSNDRTKGHMNITENSDSFMRDVKNYKAPRCMEIFP